MKSRRGCLILVWLQIKGFTDNRNKRSTRLERVDVQAQPDTSDSFSPTVELKNSDCTMCLSSNNSYRSEYLTASNHTVTERRVEQMVKLNQI